MDRLLSLDKLTKWLALLETPLATLAAEHRSFYRTLYPKLRLFYEAAGSPNGAADEDMWRWWQERATAERDRWLAMHRQKYADQPAPSEN